MSRTSSQVTKLDVKLRIQHNYVNEIYKFSKFCQFFFIYVPLLSLHKFDLYLNSYTYLLFDSLKSKHASLKYFGHFNIIKIFVGYRQDIILCKGCDYRKL